MAGGYDRGDEAGLVIVDLAAERGGNAEGTVMDEKVVTDNGVTIVGYTDFPPYGITGIIPLRDKHPSHDDRFDT